MASNEQTDADVDADDQRIVLPEQLAVGRAKRSTAGNKMRQLLEQEMEKDELFEEVENDVDFQEAKDEHDIVDSDFDEDSPDEAAYDEDDVEERAIEAQEKAEKRASRAKTGPAALKKASFMRPPTARPPPPATSKSGSASSDPSASRDQRPTRRNKRISFADGATKPSSEASLRTSSRKATVKSKLETQSKLKQEEERKAQLPIRTQPKKKVRLTQDALIAEALEMEEINRENLKWFLEQEEEKKKSLRNFNKNAIKGPFIRWQSVGFDRFGNKLGEINDDDHFDEYGNLIEQAPVNNNTAVVPPSEPSSSSSSNTNPSQVNPNLNAPTLDPVIAARAETVAQKNAQSETQQVSNARIAAELRIEANARCYVSLHDLPEDSNWVDEYNYLLGNHCSWDSIPMVPTRNRPLRPKRSICPITGLPANYKDPRSGVPYHNKEAYQTLSQVLDNKFIWTGGATGSNSNSNSNSNSEQNDASANEIARQNPLHLGAYVGREDDPGAGLMLKKARLEVVKNQISSQNSWREIYSNPKTSSGGTSKNSSNLVTSTTATNLPPHLQISTASLTAAGGESGQSAGGANFTWERTGPAPGDESVILQAAMSLPEGSSRSGARRGV